MPSRGRLRTWFVTTFGKGGTGDPDEPVELVVVRAPSGPMTVARLQAEGFHAAGYEIAAWKGVGGYRILVPRRELQDATELLRGIL